MVILYYETHVTPEVFWTKVMEQPEMLPYAMQDKDTLIDILPLGVDIRVLMEKLKESWRFENYEAMKNLVWEKLEELKQDGFLEWERRGLAEEKEKNIIDITKMKNPIQNFYK